MLTQLLQEQKGWNIAHESGKILKCMPLPENKTYSFKLTKKNAALAFSVDELNGSNEVLYEIRFK